MATNCFARAATEKVGAHEQISGMFNFNGGTAVSGTSIAPLGVYVGNLLLHSGHLVIAVCFAILMIIYFLIVVSTLCRYVINYRRNKEYLLNYELT